MLNVLKGDRQPDISKISIPRNEWAEFLREFTSTHAGWMTRLETHDVRTDETVDSPEALLECVELDLEDERNLRINVIVRLDNKTIKNILFLPSHLQLYLSEDGTVDALHVDSINTCTTIRMRPRPALS